MCPYDAVVRRGTATPAARILCQDVRQPFPHEGRRTGSDRRDLSLHYFPWIETINLVTRIQHTLPRTGLFICRLNSTQDYNYGASGHPQIDQDYYLVNGEPKRFFSSTAVDKLFERGWTVLSQEHMVTGKYAQPKALWEVVVERDAQHDGQQETTDDDLTSS
ncbi:MAG: class I SAM-dependent methyltransferase [Rhodoferax sp.]|nr:class I SAM-dependent methyltransferase [Rhodoferax sp.]